VPCGTLPFRLMPAVVDFIPFGLDIITSAGDECWYFLAAWIACLKRPTEWLWRGMT